MIPRPPVEETEHGMAEYLAGLKEVAEAVLFDHAMGKDWAIKQTRLDASAERFMSFTLQARRFVEMADGSHVLIRFGGDAIDRNHVRVMWQKAEPSVVWEASRAYRSDVV